MNISDKYLLFLLLLVGVTQAEGHKANSPVYYKDRENHNFGKLFPSGLFQKSKTSDDLNAEEVSVTLPQDCELSSRERLWNASFQVLQGFPMEKVDKSGKVWEIHTGRAQVEEFDNTKTCWYTIVVTIDEKCNINVSLNSAEDSSARLANLQDSTKKRILKIAGLTEA
ncbi:MAG: hypothetical protein LBL32_00035 [Holosporales bacterium]|nr:hypothetical protein [Holosporales bacterium]